jgi:hypothetical protein
MLAYDNEANKQCGLLQALKAEQVVTALAHVLMEPYHHPHCECRRLNLR